MSDGSSPFSIFDQYSLVVTLLSEKDDGDMKSQDNREKYVSRNNITPQDVVTLRLIHGNHVVSVSQTDKGHDILNTDGVITDQKDIFLTLTVADCLPVYLYDPQKQVIGLFHAGWKGLEKNILFKGVDLLQRTYGTDPANLLVGIGPGIGVCHFEVKDDLLDKLSLFQDAVEVRGGKSFLDLKKIAQRQLLDKGLNEENIEISPLCTYCEKEKYFSYRRDQIHPISTMIAGIGIR